MSRWLRRLSLIVLMSAAAAAAPAAADETLSHGRFEQLRLQRPAGTPTSMALLFADPAADTRRLAQALLRRGALVATIDTAAFFRTMEQDEGDCQFAGGDVDNLGRFLQAYARLPGYTPPILVGQGAGAGLVYGVLAQSKPGTFGAGIGIDFCPQMAMRAPLCAGAGLKLAREGEGFRYQPSPLSAPFAALLPQQGAACTADTAAQFLSQVPRAASGTLRDPAHPPSVGAAYGVLATRLKPAAASVPKDIADLPVIEVPSPGRSDRFAILISGDGGWAGIDKEIADRLAARGVPVVGLDSLRYFWVERTPDSTAADIAKLITHYRKAWQRDQVWLLGYSQGGDVLPFILNRLPADVRTAITLAVPMAMGEQAHFEFHLSNWIGADGTHPILPEMQRLADDATVTAICAREEDESVCRQLDARRHRLVWLSGGHHFNGDYAAVANAIFKAGVR